MRKTEILIPEQNVVDMIATPYVHDPSLPMEIKKVLLEGMVVRAFAASEFVTGNLTWDEYLQACNETGLDAIDVHNTVEEGLCFL